MSSNHNFLFASLNSKLPPTVRKIHIRRLYDILQLSIQRNDLLRAKHAWSILVRCKEFRWTEHWRTGLYILNEGPFSVTENIPQRLSFIRSMMFKDIDKESLLKELILLLILSGHYQQALDELELYLPSFPYQDNPNLHIYAGLLSLQKAQKQEGEGTFDEALLRNAQSHLSQAKVIDPSNTVAEAFLQKINTLRKRVGTEDLESDDDSMVVNDSTPRRKRLRT